MLKLPTLLPGMHISQDTLFSFVFIILNVNHILPLVYLKSEHFNAVALIVWCINFNMAGVVTLQEVTLLAQHLALPFQRRTHSKDGLDDTLSYINRAQCTTLIPD